MVKVKLYLGTKMTWLEVGKDRGSGRNNNLVRVTVVGRTVLLLGKMLMHFLHFKSGVESKVK